MTRKWLVLPGLVLVAQVFQPDRSVQTNDPEHDLIIVTAPSALVQGLLRNACYDCHSDRTTYPWYSYITPVNFWMQGHIDEGRSEFDMSSWGRRRAKWKRHKAEESIELLKAGAMPLPSYTWVHGEARLSADEREALIDFFTERLTAIPPEEVKQGH